MTHSSTGFGRRQGGLVQPNKYSAVPWPQLSAKRPISQTMAPGQYAAILTGTVPTIAGVGTRVGNVDRLNSPVWMRFVSGFIDATILLILTFIVMFVFDVLDGGLAGGKSPEILVDGPLTLTLLNMWFGYGLMFEASSWQGTPGKKVTGLVITDKSGERITFSRALGRAFAKALSGVVPFYIPYFMVATTERKQSLHDMIAGTLVFCRHDLVNPSYSVFD